MINYPQVKKGLLLDIVSLVLALAFGILTTPLIAKITGKVGYGIWTTFFTITAYLHLSDIGVIALFSRNYIFHREKENREQIIKDFANVILLLLFLSIILFTLSPLLSRGFLSFIDIQSDEIYIANILILAVVPFGLFTKFFLAIVHAQQHFVAEKAIQSLRPLLFFIAVYAVYHYSDTYRSLASAYFLVQICLIIPVLFVLKKNRIFIPIRLSQASLTGIFSTLRRSFYLFVDAFFYHIIFFTDAIVISKLMGPAHAAEYSITYKSTEILRQLVWMLPNLLSPGIAAFIAQKNFLEVKKVFIRTTRICFLIGCCFFTGVATLNHSFVSLWVGESFYAGDLVSFLMALSLIGLAWVHTSSIILWGFMDARALGLSTGFEAALNLSLSIILCIHYGLPGVILGTIVGNFANYFWRTYRACRLLNISYGSFLLRLTAKDLPFAASPSGHQ